MLVTWVNGEEVDTVPISDRGFQYGDGVWETLAIRDGHIKQFERHLQRLQQGLMALGFVDREAIIIAVKNDVVALVNTTQLQTAVLKITISRGSGGRGFYYDDSIKPRRILSLYAMPTYPDAYYSEGIRLTLCQTCLPHHPQLAGFKQLGCVEQVIARAEFQTDYQEGLMCDYNSHIIEGTMSNFFIITEQDTIITPDLQMCGIAGIARSCIVDQVRAMGIHLKITTVTETDVQQAKGIFMSNSVIRLWPVKEYCTSRYRQTYSIPALFRTLEKQLNLIL